jgi:regulator of sigma E protease
VTAVLSFIIVLGVLIFVHELGHFLAAKAAGVRVLTFSLGFGPVVFGFRRGDTHYVVSALPLGGYVKMAGDEDEMMGEQEEPKEPGEYEPGDYMYASVSRRLGIITAGPAMNIMLAFVIYFGLIAINGRTLITSTEIGHFDVDLPSLGWESGFRPGDRVLSVDGRPVTEWLDVIQRLRAGIGVWHDVVVSRGDAQVVLQVPSVLSEDGGITPGLVDSTGEMLVGAETYGLHPPYGTTLSLVEEGSAAGRAGLQEGDRIARVEGVEVERYWQVVEVVRASAGIALEMTLEHDGEERTTTVTPEERTDAAGAAYGYLGVLFDVQDLPVERVKLGLPRAFTAGVSETWEQGQLVLSIVGGLISGRISMKKTIGGPVMIARAAGDSARSGFQSLLMFIAWLSVNLGVLNLLPIPVLDGGHLVFLGAEAMRGRPLSLRVRLVATQVGMAFLLLMMIYVTYNDIVRWLF